MQQIHLQKKHILKLNTILENKINVISTAEEMSYPYASEPETAEKINRIAMENSATVLGTGINPGFIMDLMTVMLTGACRNVEKIYVERINSLSPFGPAVMEEQGVGLTSEEFMKGVKSGKLAGHVGFNESVKMICDAVGWKADGLPVQKKDAIISKTEKKNKIYFCKSRRNCRMQADW